MEQVRRALGAPEPALQAAALPWRLTKDGIEVMLITSRETRRWVLPKGWPEDGETLAGSAEREAAEEAGLKGAITPKPIGSYFYDKIMGDGDARRCEVQVYPMRVKKQSGKWPEKKERDRVWVSPSEAAGMVDEPDLAELIAGFTGGPAKSAA